MQAWIFACLRACCFSARRTCLCNPVFFSLNKGGLHGQRSLTFFTFSLYLFFNSLHPLVRSDVMSYEWKSENCMNNSSDRRMKIIQTGDQFFFLAKRSKFCLWNAAEAARSTLQKNSAMAAISRLRHVFSSGKKKKNQNDKPGCRIRAGADTLTASTACLNFRMFCCVDQSGNLLAGPFVGRKLVLLVDSNLFWTIFPFSQTTVFYSVHEENPPRRKVRFSILAVLLLRHLPVFGRSESRMFQNDFNSCCLLLIITERRCLVSVQCAARKFIVSGSQWLHPCDRGRRNEVHFAWK